jgi:hypothetical protein
MKKLQIIFILIAVFQIQYFFAEDYKYVPFPQSDAIWSEVYYYPENSARSTSYERFTINGEDTVIGSLTYKKIFMFTDSVFERSAASYIGALREDENKKVWFRGNEIVHPRKPLFLPENEDILLYDFSINLGDTLRAGNFDIFFGSPEEMKLVVSGIDTVLMGDSYRKRIKFRFPDSDWWGFYPEWIEGIGSTDGLFFTSWYVRPTCSCETNTLIGFKDNGEILYFDDAFPSFYPTDIQKPKDKTDGIQVSWVSDHAVRFDFGTNQISELQIYTITGMLQDNYPVEKQTGFILPAGRYASGVYIYKVVGIDENIYTGKLIIK